MTREEAQTLAQAAVKSVAWQLPEGAEVVVLVTKPSAPWVAVSANVDNGRVIEIVGRSVACLGGTSE